VLRVMSLDVVVLSWSKSEYLYLQFGFDEDDVEDPDFAGR